MKKAYQIVIVTLTIFMVFSCGGKYEGQSEGEIHFNVTYPKLDKDNFMRDFLPKKMLTKFKDDRMSNMLSAGMGMFQFGLVTDVENQQLIRTAKLINKKYSLNLQDEEVFNALKKEAPYDIQFTKEIKKILGFDCKKIVVTVKDGSNDTFSAYYTDEINIENPNWFNHYAPVKGVLLEYEYEKYDMRMHMVATKIHFKELEEDAFEVSEKYLEINEEKMDEEMVELFGSFQ